MIHALVGGYIHGQPTRRVGKTGKPFVTAKVRADEEFDAVLIAGFPREPPGPRIP